LEILYHLAECLEIPKDVLPVFYWNGREAEAAQCTKIPQTSLFCCECADFGIHPKSVANGMKKASGSQILDILSIHFSQNFPIAPSSGPRLEYKDSQQSRD